MAVESFIPISESKITIEKLVKPKPSMKDLTTVEKHGTITQEDEKIVEKQKKSKKSKPKAYAKLEPSKRDITLIITEKPQAALKIASALSNTAKKYSENNVPYYELERNNKKIIVASAVGHLFNLTYVKGQTGWPIFNLEWIPSYEGKNAFFTKNYYLLLKKLGRRAKEVIVATDYDVEGELIGWNVLRFIIGEKDAKRMKYSTLTKPELEKSYENPMKTLDWGQAFAGETRHKIDWLYGINLSRALMSAIKQAGSFKILSIGRVQGPALKIIVDRDKEIDNFKSQPYWQVFAKVKDTELKHVKDIFDEKELNEFKDIKSGVAETTEKEEHYSPPHPFDLTTLQREAYAHIRLNPSRTLQIAQSLYLDGIISYPRTSSQKIPKEIEPKKIIAKLLKQFPEAKLATRDNPIEGEKSDPAHPCFTEDTNIRLKKENVTFKKLIEGINKWKYDKEKKSFYSKINLQDVLSYNHENKSMVYSKAYQIWKTPIKSEIIKFREVGLKITKNHPIYSVTKTGINYMKAENLELGDYIFKEREIEDKKYDLNLNEKEILRAYSKNNRKQVREINNLQINKNYHSLKKIISEITLKKAIKLAKIVGFCIGDGHIRFKNPSKYRENYPSTHFVGKIEDMQDLKKDIENLGFTSYIQKVRSNKSYAFLSSKNSLLGRLLISLGCPTGDKVSQAFDIPKWIKNSQNKIKSAFIGGLFSAELVKTRIHTKNPRDIRPYTFAQHKIKKFKKSFVTYLVNLQKMLRELNIDTAEPKIKDSIIRKKDRKRTIKGVIDIKNNRINLINFLSTIDFGYCSYKEQTYRKALAYLLYKNRLISHKISLRKKAENLYKKGLSFDEISGLLNLSKYTVKGWLYYSKGKKENHVSIKDIVKYKDFEFESPIGCIPIEIKSKNTEFFKGYVYDLEIENTNTFFPEGVLVHNCIFPTGEFKKLSGEDEKLYNLIALRFISCFSPNAIGISKRIQLISGNQENIASGQQGKKFTSNGLTITQKGWTKVYPTIFEEKQIPTINGNVSVDKISFVEKETQPPKRYTPASLVTVLEKKSLGTKCLTYNTPIKINSNNHIHNESIGEIFDELSNNSQVINHEGTYIAINTNKKCFSFDNFEEKEDQFKLISKRSIGKDEKVYRVEYQDGSSLEATENHPVMTFKEKAIDYTLIKYLKQGMKSIVSIKFPEKGGNIICTWEEILKKCNERTQLYSLLIDLKKRRKEENLSQHLFGKNHGILQSNISNYERQKILPLYIIHRLKMKKPEYIASHDRKIIIKNPFPLKMNSSLARIVSNLVGDGSIDSKKIKKENCYDFRYHNTNISLINRFINDLRIVFGVNLEINSAKLKEGHLQAYYVKIPAVIGRIISLIFSEVIVKNAVKLDKEFYPEYIGALFDDEGHATKSEPKIFISNTNFKLLKEVKKMLLSLEINSMLNKKQFKLYIRGRKNIQLFIEKIPIASIVKKQRIIDMFSNFYKHKGTSCILKQLQILVSLSNVEKKELTNKEISIKTGFNMPILRYYLNLLIKDGYIKRKIIGIKERPRKRISYQLQKAPEETFFKYVNEQLISQHFITKTITSIKEINYNGFVYDITNNEKNPNFIIGNGIVVHNSTRSAIIDILFNRGYLDGKSIQATPLGIKLIEALEKYSPIIIDEDLTRQVEEKTEAILEAKSNWVGMENETIKRVEQLITDISKEFKINELSIGKQILSGVQDLREQQKEQNTLMPCTKCNVGNLQIRYSKKSRRSFVGCTNYPQCTAVYSLPPNAMIKKTDKMSDRNLPILMALRKGKRPWEFEFDPSWKPDPNYRKEVQQEVTNDKEKPQQSS